MRIPKLVSIIILGCALLPFAATAKEKKPGPPEAIGWIELKSGPKDYSTSLGDLQKATRTVPRGAVLPVFKTTEKRGVTRAQVRVLNWVTGMPEFGWMEIDPADVKPIDAYPPDSDLLDSLGGVYLEDVTSKHTVVSRFLLRQAAGPPSLVCYLVTMPAAMARLVIFSLIQGKYQPGAYWDFPSIEMQSGISALELRDLVGDGSDCLISHEAFRDEAQTNGVYLLIRKVVDGQFRVVWKVPTLYKNLSQYSAKIQVLQPPEQNIGAPGTKTTGDVTYLASGKAQIPVWKGKVEFFIIDRERPVNTVDIEKACPWDGREFAPLR